MIVPENMAIDKHASANNVNSASTPNHVAPARQSSMKRGGGISSANVAVFSKRHTHKDSQTGGFGSQSHSGNDHHHQHGSYRRGNDGQHLQDGSYHHNYEGKQDHNHGNQ